MGNPYCNDDHVTPFCCACTNCTQKKSQFKRISREGITKILLDLFISLTKEKILTMDNVVAYIHIMNYPNSQKLIFDKTLKKYEQVRIKKILFQLITFEILTVTFSVTHSTMIFQLARSSENVLDLSITSDEVWDSISTLFGDANDVNNEDEDEFSL